MEMDANGFHAENIIRDFSACVRVSVFVADIDMYISNSVVDGTGPNGIDYSLLYRPSSVSAQARACTLQ